MKILGPKDRSKTLRSGYLFPVFPLWDHLELAVSQVNWDYYFRRGILYTSIFQTLMCLQITLGDYEDAILILRSRVGVELFPFYLASRWYKYYNSVNHILTSKIFSDCVFAFWLCHITSGSGMETSQMLLTWGFCTFLCSFLPHRPTLLFSLDTNTTFFNYLVEIFWYIYA